MHQFTLPVALHRNSEEVVLRDDLQQWLNKRGVSWSAHSVFTTEILHDDGLQWRVGHWRVNMTIWNEQDAMLFKLTWC